MTHDLQQHFEAIRVWIDVQRVAVPLPESMTQDERKQLQVVNRTIEQLAKLGVAVPEDLRKLKLDLSAKDTTGSTSLELKERITVVREVVEELRLLFRASRDARRKLRQSEKNATGKKVYGISVSDLIAKGFLSTSDKLELQCRKSGPSYPGRLHVDGSVAVMLDSDWKEFVSLSAAAVEIAGRPINGWSQWSKVDEHGKRTSLHDIRARYLAERKKS